MRFYLFEDLVKIENGRADPLEKTFDKSLSCCKIIQFSTVIVYFHPKITKFKFSCFTVTYDKGYDDWFYNVNNRKRLFYHLNQNS